MNTHLNNRSRSPRRRDPDATRQRLLLAAFHEMQRVGFRNADTMTILRQAGVTKGALYHHFENKRALGYAVIDEILRDWILERWTRPLLEAPDPVAALVELARWGERHATATAIALGCPLAVLAEELSTVDEGFRLRLAEIYDVWRDRLTRSLATAQQRGGLRSEIDPRVAATFIVAAWSGSIGLAKTFAERETLTRCRKGLEDYLQSLRPHRADRESGDSVTNR